MKNKNLSKVVIGKIAKEHERIMKIIISDKAEYLFRFKPYCILQLIMFFVKWYVYTEYLYRIDNIILFLPMIVYIIMNILAFVIEMIVMIIISKKYMND